jgi:hypothetical protein
MLGVHVPAPASCTQCNHLFHPRSVSEVLRPSMLYQGHTAASAHPLHHQGGFHIDDIAKQNLIKVNLRLGEGVFPRGRVANSIPSETADRVAVAVMRHR